MKVVAPLQTKGRRNGLRLIPIIGENMEPTLRRGGFVLAMPTDAYDGEGMYVLDFGGGSPAIYRVAKNGGSPTFSQISDNPVYKPHEVSSEWLSGAVTAKVVFGVKVIDHGIAAALQEASAQG